MSATKWHSISVAFGEKYFKSKQIEQVFISLFIGFDKICAISATKWHSKNGFYLNPAIG